MKVYDTYFFSIYKNEIVSSRKSGLPDLCLSADVLSAQLMHRRFFVVLQAVLSLFNYDGCFFPNVFLKMIIDQKINLI